MDVFGVLFLNCKNPDNGFKFINLVDITLMLARIIYLKSVLKLTKKFILLMESSMWNGREV